MLFSLGSCNKDNRSEEIRGDTDVALSKCRIVADSAITYHISSNTDFKVPKWALNIPLENMFTKNCELTKIKIHFAYLNGKLVLIPHPGFGNPSVPVFPTHFPELTLYLTFNAAEPERTNKVDCKNKANSIFFNKYQAAVCYSSESPTKSPNLPNWPYYPEFEVYDNGAPIAKFTCSHDELSAYTLNNIEDLNIKYSCRGNWVWKGTASAMFDINGDVVKNAGDMLMQAEAILDSWVIK